MSKNFTVITVEEGGLKHHFYCEDEECLYKHNGSRGDIKYLKCLEDLCEARAKIENEFFVRTGKPPIQHHHPSHQHIAVYEKAYQQLRLDTRRNVRRTIKELHAEALRHLSLEASGMLVWEGCRRTLNRIRFRDMPPCHSVGELSALFENMQSKVYERFGKMRGTDFYQNTIEGNMIFANQEIISELPEEISLSADGTFKIVPFKSRQLLIMMADLQGRPRPIIYVLMQSKSTVAYKAVFEYIRDSVISFDGVNRTPTSAMSDCELAMRNALVETWPNIILDACNFHHVQALRRKASKTPTLSTHISGNTTQHRALKMIMRISLLPVERLMEGIEAVGDYIIENNLWNDFEAFLEYYDRTWVDGNFPPEQWCVGHRVNRTNNFLEGYNHSVKLTIPLNPRPWEFLEGIYNLALNASSAYASDKSRNAQPPIDRSRLTEPLHAALNQLEVGAIDVAEFLYQLAEF